MVMPEWLMWSMFAFGVIHAVIYLVTIVIPLIAMGFIFLFGFLGEVCRRLSNG